MFRSAFRRLAALTAIAVAAIPCTLAAQARPDDSLAVDRLATLGRLFGAVKYFHPAFLERNVPWDSAMVVAIDRVIAAKNDEEYVAAITALLESVGDPATRVIKGDAQARHAGPVQQSRRWELVEGDSILVFGIPDLENWMGANELLTAAMADVRKGTPVILDLRGPEPAEQER